MQNFFVAVKHDGGTDYLKTTTESRESLLDTLPDTLGCPRGAIARVVRVFDHEFGALPAASIATSAGLFKIVLGKMDTSRGAPMGRGNVGPEKRMKKTMQRGGYFDRKVALSEGYDAGGAYWGWPNNLRVTYNADLTYICFYRN